MTLFKLSCFFLAITTLQVATVESPELVIKSEGKGYGMERSRKLN
jgi:hypothetical protein